MSKWFLGFFLAVTLTIQADNPLKVLHLTFHQGCTADLVGVAKELPIELTTWYIPDLPTYFLDGVTKGNALYNMGHERAKNIWEKHRDFFNEFDVVITSDTVPLSRIFLQNGWEKPLIIWVCNRFDYFDAESLDCDFPDDEYYELFSNATHQENVTIVAYNKYERYFALTMGIDIGPLLIKPSSNNKTPSRPSGVYRYMKKKELFFLPPYHNETQFMNLSPFLKEKGIQNYCGRYSSPYDLEEFRAIIHLPYAWSNLALFENTSLGIPYLIPSIPFLEELISQGNYFHPNLGDLVNLKLYQFSEWYCEENQDLFIYFDSWDDLAKKVKEIDFQALREPIKLEASRHREEMLKRWRSVLQCG